MEGAEPDAAAILYFPMPPFPCVSDAKIADIEVAPKVAFDPFDLMPAQKEIMPFPPKLMPFPELEPFPPKLMPFPKMPFPKKKDGNLLGLHSRRGISLRLCEHYG
jgi:hypothetical protein